jgi:large subunit ribosomal protein L35
MAMKTHKALAKRLIVTGAGKLMKRKAGQGHFNSGESGNTTRNKRTDVGVPNTMRRLFNTYLPYIK